jgi:TorA maturation chaperone TorD
MSLDTQEEGEDLPAGAAILAAVRGERDAPELSQRLAVEHTRLFGGIREAYGPPPPYESLWREGQMMGETTVSVLKAYAAAGFQPDGYWGPPDHLIEELRFMAALAHEEASVEGENRERDLLWARSAQIEFLDGHLLAWTPGYCRELSAKAKEPFYRALADVAAAVLTDDARYLRENSGG